MDAQTNPRPAFPGVRLIVFDLDGTLVDTFADITAAVNHALAQLNCPALDQAAVMPRVGHGARNLVRACLGADAPESRVNQAYEAWCAYYAAHPADHARTYPGVEQTLAALRARSIRLALLSNKVDAVTRQIMDALSLSRYFDFVLGETPERPRKPDPAALVEIMTRLGASARETLMVGDGEADIGVARNAGVAGIGVAYGVTPALRLRELGAAFVIERIESLVGLVG